MDLFEQISKDIVAAMKAKDKIRLETLRNIKKFFIEAKTGAGRKRHVDGRASAQNLVETG